jgi:hypothetical protein
MPEDAYPGYKVLVFQMEIKTLRLSDLPTEINKLNISLHERDQ